MGKKLATIVACAFAAVLFAAPTPAWAVDYDVTVAGTTVTDANASNVLGDGTVSYNPDERVLSLNGATLNADATNRSIYVTGNSPITIEVTGTNSCTGFIQATNNDCDLTIRGEGSLAVETNGSNASAIQIYGDLVIDSVELTLTANGDNGYAVHHPNSITVQNGARVDCESLYGVHAEEGGLKVTGNGTSLYVERTGDRFFGLETQGTIAIEDGAAVEVLGGTIGHGISISSGGSLTSVGDSAAHAVECEGPLTVENGTLDASFNEACIYSGIMVHGTGADFTATNSTIRSSTVATENLASYALYAEGSAVFDGGSATLDVVSGGYAVYALTDVTVQNGTALGITGGYGLVANGDVALDGATGAIAVDETALFGVANVSLTNCTLDIDAGNRAINTNSGEATITGCSLDLTGTRGIYARTGISIADSELDITATANPLYATSGSITISGDDTQVMAQGGDYVGAGGEVVVSGGTVDVTVTASLSDSSVEAVYGKDAVRISGGTVHAVASKGEGNAEAYTLRSGGEIALTGGIITLEGDAGAIDTASGGNLNFGGTNWYQWATSAAGEVTKSESDAYDSAGQTDTYLRIEPVGTTYDLAVSGGEGTGSYVAGTQVAISADAFDASGHFAGWTVNDPTGAGALADSSARETTFTMPAGAVELTANYESHAVLEHVAAVDPSCTSEGTAEHWKCSECGALFSDDGGTMLVSADDLSVSALGHDYVDGVCTACGEKDPDYVAPEEPKKNDTTIPATGDASVFASLVPALLGGSALAAGVVARRRR